MAYQSGFPSGFGGNGNQTPFNNNAFRSARNIALPQYMIDVIDTVTLHELMNANNHPPGLFDNIAYALPGTDSLIGGHPLLAWFMAVYTRPAWMGPDSPQAREDRFMDFIIVNIPAHIRARMSAEHNDDARRGIEGQWRARRFLHALLTELAQQNFGLALDFLDAVRPAPHTALSPAPVSTFTRGYTPPPAPSPSPLPAPNQGPSRSPAPAPPVAKSCRKSKVATSTQPKKDYYCPTCANTHAPGKWNNMRRHWFQQHARSNRSAAELKRHYDSGAMGPWTEDEAREEQKDKKAVAETAVEEERRSKMKKASRSWFELRQTDPVGFERAAQEADGYSDFDATFVSNEHKERKEKKEAKKDKDEDKDKDKSKGKGKGKGKEKKRKRGESEDE